MGIPAICCIGGVGVCWIAGKRASSEVEAERTQAHKLGMPIDINEVLPPRPAPETNAAPIYVKLARLVSGPLKDAQTVVNNGLGNKVLPEKRAAAIAALAQLQPVFDEIKQLDSKPNCCFDREWSKGPSLLFPEFAGIRPLLKDLCLKADVLDENGDTRGALKMVSYAQRVSRDAGSDPVLISMLVSIACRAVVNKEFERLIEHHSADTTFLNLVESSIKANAILPNLRFYIGGEIAFNRLSLRSLQSMRDISYTSEDENRTPSSLEKSFFKSGLVQDTLEARLLQAWESAWPKLPKDRNAWQESEDVLRAMERSVDADHSLGNTLNRILLPVFDSASEAIGTLQAHDRLLITAIEVLKSRAIHSKFPAATPSSLGVTRMDPFDGLPLRYSPSDDGFILYSIGRDRRDDGGHVRSAGDTDSSGIDEVVQFHVH